MGVDENIFDFHLFLLLSLWVSEDSKDPSKHSRESQTRVSQESLANFDNTSSRNSRFDLDTNPESVLDEDVLKSSLKEFDNSVENYSSASIQIENEKTSYLEALRSIFVENAADDYLERKLVHDLLKTQSRDSDLFQASCCGTFRTKASNFFCMCWNFLSRSSSSK